MDNKSWRSVWKWVVVLSTVILVVDSLLPAGASITKDEPKKDETAKEPAR